MTRTVGCSRIDDLVGGTSWAFGGVVAVHRALTHDEVRPVLEAVREAARSGHWLVGYVAYEAGSAFDGALRAGLPPEHVPLVCFVEYRSRTVPERLGGVGARPLGLIERLGGSEWFEHGVGTIRERIAAGDVYQVNLTDRLLGPMEFEPLALYRQMALAQRGPHNALLDLGPLVIVSASPELFFEFDGTTVTTKPMKGTMRRGVRDVDDDAIRRALVDSAKERAENVMIVDLVRNDLSKVAVGGGVTVPRLFEAERYETVWQMTSTVRAVTRAGTTFVDVMAALFPAGSVTGAPKVAAAAVIDELEPAPRGIYCGAIGLVAPNPSGPASEPVARFSVAIRTAVIDRLAGTFTYGAGGGITSGSDPLAEEAELKAKTAVLSVRRPEFDLFETLLFDSLGARHLERHLTRLGRSACYFGFRCDLDEIRRLVGNLGSRAPSRLRIVLARCGSPRIELECLGEVPAEVTLGVASTRVSSSDPFSCHKTTFRDHYRRALAECPGADDAVVVNERDEVVETTVASLLYECDGQWFTPPLSSGGLDGIGRRLALEAGEVAERTLRVGELGDCAALAVVSSLRGRRPARLLADHAPSCGAQSRPPSP